MSELDTPPSRSISGALIGVVAAALLIAIGGVVWTYMLSTRLARAESGLNDANDQNAKLAAQLRETNARLKVTSQEMGQSLGLTQKQMEARTQQMLVREQEDSRRLETAQKAAEKEVAAVNSAVTDVKTDVGGVKTDVAKTQTDLASAVSQMQSMKGDLGMQSGLIAHTHDELEVLKHRGDRLYYEFTLSKGQKKPVSTVSLELKKSDPKKNKFTLDVYADDKKVEKKDKNINEPLQFYTGKDPMLYELVVNNINAKNQITGYISTPKTAPVPPAVAKE